LELVCGRNLEEFGDEAREVLECYKLTLKGDSDGKSEDKEANKNADSEGQVHEVSNGSENSIGNWTRGHLCYILSMSWDFV
jgi:hypothetical protein